jgi:hypothetical protein
MASNLAKFFFPNLIPYTWGNVKTDWPKAMEKHGESFIIKGGSLRVILREKAEKNSMTQSILVTGKKD